MRQSIILFAPELLSVLDGEARPSGPASNAAAVAALVAWEKANGRLYSLLYFATSGSAQLTVRAHERQGDGAMGDGAAAWAVLRRACHAELYRVKHKSGGDPIDFFANGTGLRLRLHRLGGGRSPIPCSWASC